MGDIPPIKAAARPVETGLERKAREVDPRDRAAASQGRPADRVEISEMGQLLSTLETRDDIRVEKVMAIRESIANGTYDTEGKLEYAIGRLLEELRIRGVMPGGEKQTDRSY